MHSDGYPESLLGRAAMGVFAVVVWLALILCGLTAIAGVVGVAWRLATGQG